MEVSPGSFSTQNRSLVGQPLQAVPTADLTRVSGEWVVLGGRRQGDRVPGPDEHEDKPEKEVKEVKENFDHGESQDWADETRGVSVLELKFVGG